MRGHRVGARCLGRQRYAQVVSAAPCRAVRLRHLAGRPCPAEVREDGALFGVPAWHIVVGEVVVVLCGGGKETFVTRTVLPVTSDQCGVLYSPINAFASCSLENAAILA